LIVRVLRFLRGYLEIEIAGNALERLINQINKAGIELWDLQRDEKGNILTHLYYEDFKRLRPVVRNRKCRININKKQGFPFLLNNIFGRRYFLIGIIIFFLILYTGSTFLLFIEIEGLEKIDEQKIINILLKSGVKRGIMKRAIDIERLESELFREEPGIAWVDISWKGTLLHLKIVEKKMIEENWNGDIVAARDGIISEVIVLKGKPLVREGDTVSAGQPLIITTGNQETARGIVKAYVWYEEEIVPKYIRNELFLTGRERKFLGVKYSHSVIWFPPKRRYYDNYLRKEEIKTLLKWRNIVFPIELVIEEHQELKVNKNCYTSNTALFLAKEKALQELLSRLLKDSVILDISVELNDGENQEGKAKLLLKVVENIAIYD